MELIPILSTIILVATISTFILAIGAYILYKIRERKGQQATAPQPREIEAELYTPAAAPQPQEKQAPAPAYAQAQSPSNTVYIDRQPIFVQERQPMQPRFTPQPQQYNSQRSGEPVMSRERAYQGAGNEPVMEEEKKFSNTKFLKYTTEGYVDPKNDKNSGALKWR